MFVLLTHEVFNSASITKSNIEQRNKSLDGKNVFKKLIFINPLKTKRICFI
jgi:hypothetical protein